MQVDPIELADAIEGFLPTELSDGKKLYCLRMGERQRDEVIRCLRAAAPRGSAEIPMAGNALSKEETDSAIEALKRGESVSFSFSTGPRS